MARDGPQAHSAEGCRIMMNAIRLVDPVQARNELQEARRVAAWTLAGSLVFLAIWTLLIIVRFRALKERRSKITMDVICIALSGSATLASAFGAGAVSFQRHYPFAQPVRDSLRDGGWITRYHVMWTLFDKNDPCLNQFRAASGIDGPAELERLMERANLLQTADSSSALFYVTVTACCAAAILLMVSIINIILSLCVKSHPENNNRIWTSGSNNVLADGAMPPSQAVEHFMQYIEMVPPSADGVVLGAGREGADCRICLEVLLEDIARLHGCQHTFHRRCILRWLVNSNDPSCPLCKEPLRGAEQAIEYHGVYPDYSTSVHVHNTSFNNSNSAV